MVAAIGMLSTLTLLTPALDFTLPIGRFGGLIFIVAASALLPATRHRLTADRPGRGLALRVGSGGRLVPCLDRRAPSGMTARPAGK